MQLQSQSCNHSNKAIQVLNHFEPRVVSVCLTNTTHQIRTSGQDRRLLREGPRQPGRRRTTRDAEEIRGDHGLLGLDGHGRQEVWKRRESRRASGWHAQLQDQHVQVRLQDSRKYKSLYIIL